MTEFKGSDVRLFIDGFEVQTIGEDDLMPIVVKVKHTSMSLETHYLGCKDGKGNPQGYHIWIAQAYAFKLYPICQAYWVKPTKKQLRKFKRHIRKNFQH